MAKRPTPLAKALSEAIRTHGTTARDVAIKADVPETTLRSKLNGQTALEPLRKTDQELVRAVAGAMGVDPESIFREAESIAINGGTVDDRLLSLYLSTLKDCKAPADHRDAAEEAIIGMFRQFSSE